jgi:hypothetical protein
MGSFKELAQRAREFHAIRKDAHDLCASLTGEQFNWRPEPGVWSVGQCLEHLNLTNHRHLVNIGRAISEARVKHRFGEGPFRYGPLDWLVVRVVQPPVKIKVKAPKNLAPQMELDQTAVLAEFLLQHEKLLERVADARGLHLRRVKVESLASEWLRFSLGPTFALISAHDRRHLLQAKGLLTRMEVATPSASRTAHP